MAWGPHSPATKPLSLMPRSSALVQVMMLMMHIGRATPTLIMLVFLVKNNLQVASSETNQFYWKNTGILQIARNLSNKRIFSFFFFQIKFIGVSLVNNIISFSGVQDYN